MKIMYLLQTILLAVSLLLAAEKAAAGESNANASVDLIVNRIAALPSWIDTGADAWGRMIQDYIVFTNWEPDLIRTAIVTYISRFESGKKYDVSAMSRLFILNRVLFKVPKSDTNWKSNGGWDAQADSPLWPLERNAQGDLKIAFAFRGYNGPSYFALEEFDYFRKHYEVNRKR